MDARSDVFDAFSPTACKSFARAVDRVGHRLHVELEGIDRLPKGRALLVANHAFGFWDLAFGLARITVETGRPVFTLAEHLWRKVPVVKRLVPALGLVDGTPRNADAILERDELLLVLPGGLREALKPRELRYRLLWGKRYGFIRAALRNRAPIVPFACIGGDEIFDLVGDPFERGRHLGLRLPLPRPRHLLPIPHRTRLRFLIGEPISVDHRGDERDRDVLRSLRREVEGAIHELIEEELARRAGFAYAELAPREDCASAQELRAPQH